MKFLKSYTGGLVVLAVVIVLSVLLGSHRSLVGERAKVEAQFAPIAGDLQDCLDITANVLSVAERYLEESRLTALEESRNMLSDWHGVSSGYTAYTRLQEEAAALLDELEGCGLTDRDAEYVRGFRADLAAEADTIARDGYNAAAEDFNREVLGGFPANLLGRLTFVAPAELFE